jgi:hypothetical protein
MALSLTQTPTVVSLAQSPIIFTVVESNAALLTSSSFQYVGDLYYWQGATTASGSTSQYTITKYPNSAGVGIFDLNRIINSTLTDLAQANTSSVVYFAVDFYSQFYNGTQFITGSHLKSSTFKALDGYGVFPEPIGQSITASSVNWPLMTSGPATQSAMIDNTGNGAIYVGTTGGTQPTRVIYLSNLGAGSYAVSGTTATTGQIAQYPLFPAQSGFPLSTVGLEWYSVQPWDASVALAQSIKYNIVCKQKYPNVRIKWKNRFGQFDWYNFDLVSRESFSTIRKTYQPQLGSWESSTLSYQNYDSANLAYIVDSKQGLSVNTNWLDDAYNEIMKQLLVSDEIYWIYGTGVNDIRPISIVTQNIVFKTGVVDKLIQYQFDFEYGQPYKLIL